MYLAIQIADYFLKLSLEKTGKGLYMISLIKLPYIAHGFTLALTGGKKRLCNERVAVWKYGPVYPEIYHAFKEQPSPKTKLVHILGPEMKIHYDDFLKRVMDNVFKIYGRLSPTELSLLTHQKGSPWFKAKEKGKEYIEDSEIETYYKKLLNKNIPT